ncbi:MAG: alkyl sulfatase dimerization domain-containing protein [Acidimicrobiia bacterium]
MSDLLDLADELWAGEPTTTRFDPMRTFGGEDIADGVFFLASFGNVTAVDTGDALLLVDTGLEALATGNHAAVRQWSDAPVHTAVFTHGHIDHVGGLAPFEADAAAHGRTVSVVAHEAVPRRFDRYAATNGYNTVINRRQFGAETGFTFPGTFRLPDTTYTDRLTLTINGEDFELHHGRGETDDATWVFMPQRCTLCSGDFFIWASPNAGNPQKVQRYAADWARALRDMAACNAHTLLPGHGPPILGADRVRRALVDTAEFLEVLEGQTRDLMNAGASLDDVLHTVEVPAHLAQRPYLQPIYDEPEFVVRNVWRLLGGWWDGNQATLHPAPEDAVATEIADLAGGPGVLADRARALASAGDLRLAGHLIELAANAAPDDPGVHRIRAAIMRKRREAATSTMARGIYGYSAQESEAVLESASTDDEDDGRR